PYSPSNPQRYFLGKTGGQMVGGIIASVLKHVEMPILSSAETILTLANEVIWQNQTDTGISIDDASKLAGATFAFAEIKEEGTRIYHGGDCYAAWQMKSGETGITHNSFWLFEAELRAKIAELMEQTNGDRTKMWDMFYPFLCQKRRENANKPGRCALLNGQPELVNCWDITTLSTPDIELLILFTDGLVPFSHTAIEEHLKQIVLRKYSAGGLHRILSWARAIERDESALSHQTHAEATAIAVHFS
ncbi:MAG: hypothetical protein NTW46_03190, partial [Candidatus Nealsonbacteria bacterium]|nr:hypothetical protein [Candidatus Nealsonbacteria bacterium]